LVFVIRIFPNSVGAVFSSYVAVVFLNAHL